MSANNTNTRHALSLWLSILSLVWITLTVPPLYAGTDISLQPKITEDAELAIDWWVHGADAHTVKSAELWADDAGIAPSLPVVAPNSTLHACYLFMTDTSRSMKGQLKTAVIPLLTDLVQKKPPQHFTLSPASTLDSKCLHPLEMILHRCR